MVALTDDLWCWYLVHNVRVFQKVLVLYITFIVSRIVIGYIRILNVT